MKGKPEVVLEIRYWKSTDIIFGILLIKVTSELASNRIWFHGYLHFDAAQKSMLKKYFAGNFMPLCKISNDVFFLPK